MPKYLAYQFGPEQLTRDRLVRLMDDYFGFELRNGPQNAEEWFKSVDELIKKCKSLPNGHVMLDEIGETPFEKANLLATDYRVKNHPLLEIFLRSKDSCPHCPDDFTGLNIWAAHSGSEGLVDLIQFKPEMDAYLQIIGINYQDRSNL